MDLFQEISSLELYGRMTSNEKGRRLGESLRRIADHVCEHDHRMRDIHPYFTLHDRAHCLGVARKLDSICDAVRLLTGSPSALTPEEGFILLGAACLHDIGMYVFDDEAIEKNMGRRMGAAELAAYVRRSHPWLSANHVYDHGARWGLDAEYYRRCLAAVCLGHSSRVGLKGFPDVGPGRIRTGGLSKLLRVGDVLDIEFSRAPDEMRQRIFADADGEKIGLLHWMKHHYVQDVQLLYDQRLHLLAIRALIASPSEELSSAVARVIEWTIGRELESFGGTVDEFSVRMEQLDSLQLPVENYQFLSRRVGSDDVLSLLPSPELSVLVVDDNQDELQLLATSVAEMAEEHDLRVVRIDCAGDSAEAERLLGENEYNVVVLDIMIPRERGSTPPEARVAIALVARITEACAVATIIGVTGRASRSDVVDLMRTGVTDVIEKSIPQGEFSERLWNRVRSIGMS